MVGGQIWIEGTNDKGASVIAVPPPDIGETAQEWPGRVVTPLPDRRGVTAKWLSALPCPNQRASQQAPLK